MQICQLEGLPFSLQTQFWRWESQGFWALCMPYGDCFLDMFLACRLGHVEAKISLRNTDGKSVAGLTLALATLGRLLSVALPSRARSSLPGVHRATETQAPAPACGGGTQPPFY